MLEAQEVSVAAHFLTYAAQVMDFLDSSIPLVRCLINVILLIIISVIKLHYPAGGHLTFRTDS